jgi:putative hydrolase
MVVFLLDTGEALAFAKVKALKFDAIFKGKYLFHLHTVLTDGQLSISDYLDFAMHNQVDRLIFLEHIRLDPTYSATDFAENVHSMGLSSGVEVVVGFEARVMPGGELDICDQSAALGSVIGIAEHRFELSEKQMVASLIKAFKSARKRFPAKELVWVHPGLWRHKGKMKDVSENAFMEIVNLAISLDIKIEHNLRYRLLELEKWKALPVESRCIGADAHSFPDLENWKRRYMEFSTIRPHTLPENS